MKPSTLASAVATLIDANQPGFVWGEPGVGKSAIIRQVADAKFGATGRKPSDYWRDIRAVLLDPTDLRGLPTVVGTGAARVVQWAPPGFLPTEGEGVLFLDELNAAPALVQNACLQLALDRRIGEYEVPPGWRIMAAGNRAADGAAVTRMSTALRDRFTHLTLEADFKEWRPWAVGAGAVRPEIVAFLTWQPKLLSAFSRDAAACPSPRSWVFASRIMDAKPKDDALDALLSGTIGEGTAKTFTGFLKVMRTLPNIKTILEKPTEAPLPKNEPDVYYALTSCLANAATPDTMGNLVIYADRLPQDFAVVLMKGIKERPELVKTRAYGDWAVKNKQVTL